MTVITDQRLACGCFQSAEGGLELCSEHAWQGWLKALGEQQERDRQNYRDELRARPPRASESCPDGQLPDGEFCPACGGLRGPSGVGGGSWVHVSRYVGEPTTTEPR